MKKLLVMSSLVFSSALHSIAVEAGISGNTNSSKSNKVATANAEPKVTNALTAKQRATNLTNEMVKELRLNNYQAHKLRAINLEKVNKMMAIEAKGGDASAIDKDCKGVCKERDQELENILSTEQYSQYFGNRNNFYKLDKDYAFGGYLSKPTAATNTNADDDSDEISNTVASR